MKIGYVCATGIVVLTGCVLVSAAVRDAGSGKVQESTSATASAAAVPAAQTRKISSRRRRFTEYQIAAGTAVSIELKTRLSSNGSHRADAIEGRLLRPLVSPGGVELVPAGATVLGTVSDVEAAGVNRPGRLAFSFQIVEHPDTGSRATVKTEVLRYESPMPVKGHPFTDIRLEKGSDASVVLLAPLLVRIPIAG